MKRVFVTRFVYPEAIRILEPVAEVDFHNNAEALPPEELWERIAAVDAIVCQLTDRIDDTLFDAAPQLKMVANVAVGYDNIDVEAATRRSIQVTNTPGVLTETTADFTWALLMATARRIVEADTFLRQGRWKRWQVDLLCGHDVHGRTLGIVGMGRIGQVVCRF